MNLVAFRTIQIDGLSIFYREAGAKNAETLLLLHGLPSSSRTFEPLFARLSDRYRLIAPDYPGFGHSDWPDPKKFAYTFDNYAEIMNHFTEALGLSRYTLYMQDYGGPVGFRMILAHPERVEALIVQDAVAHNAGLGVNWKTRRANAIDAIRDTARSGAMAKSKKSEAADREDRILMEIVVDAYDPDERAMGWYYYLEGTLGFPFTARCVARRPISPLRVRDEVEVVGMPPEDQCLREMFVTIRRGKNGLAVPLSQLKIADADAKTRQAVEDWHY